ncbi:cytochrome P450 [Actinophytocola sp.]|uniref:cytochrome P450 n=1 Tax=Actinophytocola sp. TaxID=1872138 RepID=UPI002ED2FED7
MGNPAITLPSYDVLDAGDPLERLLRISADTTLSWLPELGGYLVTGYEDVLSAMKHPGMRSAVATRVFARLPEADQEALRRLRLSIDMWMGHATEEGHHRFQKLLKRYFTPAIINGLRPRVRELTGELLDAVAADGRMDVVPDLAFPLPANVIADMLGMPTSDRDRLREWSRHIMAVFQHADVEKLMASQDSVLEMQDYLREIVADRRVSPRDDLISMFAAAEREGVVNEDEIVANCVLLLFAGHETTATLISRGLQLLMANPDQLELLVSRPELNRSAIEEMMRHGGPATSVIRETIEPVTIAGHDIPAGEHIYLAIHTANHDPTVFADPMRFDITRKNNRHLGFGMGSYYCLGAALARVESDECFRLLLSRYPNIRPATDQAPVDVPLPPFGRRLDSLPVEF